MTSFKAHTGGTCLDGSPAAEKSHPLFVPEGFTDFKCDLCGDCCRNHARVLISPAKHKRLAQVLRDTGFRFPVRDALMQDEDDPDAPAAFATVGDQCVFLTDAGHCHLCELGVPELRGPWCISFPVTPIITPRGVNYFISFACKKTVEMLRSKEPLNILALTVNGSPLPGAGRPFTARHRIPTVGDRPRLDWSGHRLIEGMLLAVARDWDVNTSTRLILMPMMLNYLLKDYTGPESNDALRERVSHAARDLPQMIEQAKSYRPDPAGHYAALNSLFARRIGFRTQTALRKQVDMAIRQVQGRRTKVPADELGAVLARLYKDHYKPNARRPEYILGNYVICRLFASRELLTGGVYKGVCVVAYLVALIRFFATTTAAQRCERINQRSLLEAVRCVERLLAQSRNFFDFLDATGEQDRMCNPAYAAMLARI